MNETIEITILYPAVEPETHKSDMVLCRCSRPDQCSAERMPWRTCCREEDDRQRREQGVDQVSSRAVSAGHSPKTWWPPFTRAGELDGRRRFGGLLFYLVCAQETERGELVLLDLWCVQKILTIGKALLFIEKQKEGGEELHQEMKRLAAGIERRPRPCPRPRPRPRARPGGGGARVWQPAILVSTSQSKWSKTNQLSWVNLQLKYHTRLNHLMCIIRTIEFYLIY
jgi:hypothetical protein